MYLLEALSSSERQACSLDCTRHLGALCSLASASLSVPMVKDQSCLVLGSFAEAYQAWPHF